MRARLCLPLIESPLVMLTYDCYVKPWRKENLKKVERLVGMVAGINMFLDTGETALYSAAEHGQLYCGRFPAAPTS